MLPSLLSGKPSPRLSHHSLVRTSRLFSPVVVILLLTFSSLAFLYVASDFTAALDDPPGDPPSLSFSDFRLYLLQLLVVGGGWLFMVLSFRFPVLRLTWWQVALILLGICLGVGISFHRVAYQEVCCMFGYNIGQGFPYATVNFNLTSDTLLSWHQVDAIMHQHPEQFTQQIAWPGLIADSMFFANLALIPVALVGVGLRLVGRAKRPPLLP